MLMPRLDCINYFNITNRGEQRNNESKYVISFWVSFNILIEQTDIEELQFALHTIQTTKRLHANMCSCSTAKIS